MHQEDYLLRAIDQGKQVRVFLARTTALCEEAHRRHGTSATASAALGRVLTAAVIMGSDLKGEKDITTIRINGQGPAGTILATADSQGGVRGFISNPRADLPSRLPGKLDVGKLVGREGYLEVIKDLGLKQPFSGRVPLVSGEIAEDLAHYFSESEQIPALVSLGVLVGSDLGIVAAGGILVQALPGAENKVLYLIENNILSMGPISSVLAKEQSLESIIVQVMSGIEYSVVGEQRLAFKCRCNRERLGAIVASLPSKEVEAAFSGEKEKNLEVVCNFCNEVYLFRPEEIALYKSQKP